MVDHKSGMMGQQSVMSESQTEVMTDQPRVNNVQSSVHVDETKPTNGGLQQVQVIHDRPFLHFLHNLISPQKQSSALWET
jgi:hypothetical protein